MRAVVYTYHRLFFDCHITGGRLDRVVATLAAYTYHRTAHYQIHSVGFFFRLPAAYWMHKKF